MTDQNTTSMSQPTGFAVGDRVRIVVPDSQFDGMTGTICDVYVRSCHVELDNGRRVPFMLAEVEIDNPVANLIALAEQCGAVERNRYVADGMLCRRFITPDGTIDLTVRVP